MFRFHPCVETTVEEKHARVSLAKRIHHIGPCRIRVANRLPCLERQIRKGHVCANQLLACFAKARRLKDCPALLGIENHPKLADLKGMKPSQVREPLADVVYRCDLQNLYRPSKEEGKTNAYAKRCEKAVEDQMLGRHIMTTVTEEGLVRDAMHTHFTKRACEGVIVSAKSGMLRVQAMDISLAAVASKRRKTETEPPDTLLGERAVEGDIDACDVEGFDTDRIFSELF